MGSSARGGKERTYDAVLPNNAVNPSVLASQRLLAQAPPLRHERDGSSGHAPCLRKRRCPSAPRVSYALDGMSNSVDPQLEEFGRAARSFCSWATSSVDPNEKGTAAAARHIAVLIAAGCALGWVEGEPADFNPPVVGADAARAKASALPFQHYSEVFNPLVVPPEEPAVGDIVDDVVDIYSDIAPGLQLYDSGRFEEAKNHWQFWFACHWGEHATSALRALWSYLAKREGSDR
jgi:hypothetical protein